MGKIYEHIVNLITKQIQDHGIVVWYDPEGAYVDFVKGLDIPDTKVISFNGSFFGLRAQIEPFLEFITEQGEPKPDCEVAPKLLIYVPMARSDTNHALVEAECAGVVMEPGSRALPRNTRLRVVADHVFKKVAPSKVEEIRAGIDKGTLSLEELDRLSTELEEGVTGAIKIIFNTSDFRDVVLQFAASQGHDKAIQEKGALPELLTLFKKHLGININPDSEPKEARKTLLRTLLLTDLLADLSEESIPKALSTVSVPEGESYKNRIKNICETWRKRLDYQGAYVVAAKDVEKELGLSALEFSYFELVGLETFPFIEKVLLDAAEAHILEGKPDKALELARGRIHSFWPTQEPVFQLHWKLLEYSAQVLLLGRRIKEEIKSVGKDPEQIIRHYSEGSEPWCLVDTYYRHLESRYASFDLDMEGGHDQLEQVMAYVRHEYTKTLELMIESFADALLDAGFSVVQRCSQKEVYGRYLKPHLTAEGKVAYMIVDALRFEMGKELGEGLVDEFGVSINACVAQLPTITVVGMAALMPQAENGMELVKAGSKVAIRTGDTLLKDRASRAKFLKKTIEPQPFVCKLSQLVKPTKKVQEQIRRAKVIVVTSQEIDQWGEEGAEEEEARIYMDEVLDKLRKAIRRLAFLGVTNFVVTADHGHIFGETIESGMKMHPPGGKTVELHRRVWIGRGGKTEEGFFRVRAADVGLGGDLELAFPRSFACFQAKGGSEAYFHGGVSLQEMVIPVIVLRKEEKLEYETKGPGVKISLARPQISTRFLSVTLTYSGDVLFPPEKIRVKLTIMSGKKEVGSAVMSAYGFEEGTKEIVLEKDVENAVTCMLTAVEGVKEVSIHVIDAVSQVELARLEKIPVVIAI